MNTETTVIISDRRLCGQLCRFAYRPACDLYAASLVINYGERYFRQHGNRWQRVEGSKMFRLTGEVLTIAEEMHKTSAAA